ncbi:MAG TPA: PGPGW domain-containing protein [Mycobacteriales bacterium]|nr:PGPGW domain-containing protein [Mycobacteriales bacterium]
MTPWNLRDRVRRLPAGEVIVHAAVFVLGAALIALGLALAVLPGPLTIPPILLGLAVWSMEFEFAERWLDPIERRAQAAWNAARQRPWRTGAATGAGLVAAAAATYLFLRLDVLGAVT